MRKAVDRIVAEGWLPDPLLRGAIKASCAVRLHREERRGLDALGAVEVPLTITGTMSSPTVRPDIGALAKGKLGQEVQQKAGDLVKKKLGDKLKDLFGH